MIKNWDCIVVTCPTLSSVISTEKEIEILKKKGRIPRTLCILTIEDPAKHIGSGAVTLNALLVVTEYLSAKQNYMVISSDVLLDSHILILHNGRQNLFSCSERAFIPLPLEYNHVTSANKPYASGVKCNLEAALELIDVLSAHCPPGVWVCSTDMMILHSNQSFKHLLKDIQDVVMFCVPSDIEYATGHGVVAVDGEGNVAEIYYCPSLEQIKDLAQDDKKVPLVSGMVFLSSAVAESLLTLHAETPIDSCTYIGLDSGNKPIQVSLFFDLLVAMCTKMTKTKFVSGKCGKTYNVKVGLDVDSSNEILLARSLIWKKLSKFKMSAKILTGCEHIYWSDCHSPLYHMSNLIKIATSSSVHSFYKIGTAISPELKGLLINSSVHAETCTVSSNAVICDSFIKVKNLKIGENTFVSGVTFIDYDNDLIIPSNLAVLNILSRDTNQNFIVLLRVQDNLSTLLQETKEEIFLKFLIQQVEDGLWFPNLISNERNLLNARLFTPNFTLKESLQLFCCDSSDSLNDLLFQKWKSSMRYSLKELSESIDFDKVYCYRRNLYGIISCEIIKEVLNNNEDTYLLPYFYAACSEGWSQLIMNTLDNVLLSDQTTTIKTRALSNMADLLSVMAGDAGGLRSGPGNNKSWEKAFELLLVSNLEAGMKELMLERSKWMDRPDHLMRAARHFERAAQILIQNSVKTVHKFIHLSSSKLPAIGSRITVRCPARIDLQGGWSDTPPICYELGGSVVNMAILIDGKKPIGAKACRIHEPHIRLKIGVGELSHEILISDLKDILNYNQPNAKGALLKAAIVCSEIIDSTSKTSLSEQLLSKFGSGFEIQSWSFLPQGCGMGTSSILAGAIIAALWTVSGKQFDKESIIHAVLFIEQLLTTGGGWQDQVSGIMGGVNRGYSNSVLQVKMETLQLSKEFVEKLNAYFLLIYTGKVRLAKNLLQSVIRNWYAREKNVVKCFKDLLYYSLDLKDALIKGDLPHIGVLMEKYWEQKKILAPGCEPSSVKEIMNLIKPLCYGQLLVGAGGGGFMCILTKEPDDIENVKAKLKGFKDYEKLTFHKISVDMKGLEIAEENDLD